MKSVAQPCAMPGWAVDHAVPLSEASWSALVRNEIPAIVIRDFASAEECARLACDVQVIGFDPYEKVAPPIDRIGATVFEHNLADAKSSYFAAASRSRQLQSQIFAQSFSPVDRLIENLRHRGGQSAQIAEDPQHGRFYAGLVRRIEHGTLLHIDFAPAEQPDWHIAAVESQLAWNLYIELDPVQPGSTTIYNRPWQAADDALKIPDSYGFQHAVVAGAERFTFSPTLGDVYIFNTRNFHEVAASRGRRTTVTSAMGTLPNGTVIVWS